MTMPKCYRCRCQPCECSWPKAITEWSEGSMGFLSIPFTWLLPAAKRRILQGDLFVKRWVVGGPAVKLMPDYLVGLADYGPDDPTVLQRVHPRATRTTSGCPRGCAFCGVRTICGQFRELRDWPDAPILCDDNLLAASQNHIERVFSRLVKWPSCDFNQGIDCRLLTTWHAQQLATLSRPVIRMALDHDRDREAWADAWDRLRAAGIAKARIRSYVLAGFDDGPAEARDRCEYVESFGAKALPMWFHPLDTLMLNPLTEQQKTLGWTHRKRRELMCWYYQHRTLEVRG